MKENFKDSWTNLKVGLQVAKEAKTGGRALNSGTNQGRIIFWMGESEDWGDIGKS